MTTAAAATVVDVTSLSPTMQVTVQACAGLLNREKPTVYTLLRAERDLTWLRELRINIPTRTSANDLLHMCLKKFRRCVTYSIKQQQALLPNILTLAAVNDAIPIDEDDMRSFHIAIQRISKLEVIDSRSIFRKHCNPVLATKYLYETCVGSTTALAMLNPGYHTWDCLTPWNPPLKGGMDPSLVDLVFKDRLFVVFLINSGIPCTAAHRLMNRIAQDNPWASPIRVYGYADHWHVFGGFLFESHTHLTASYNMGAVPTAGTANLSFFSSTTEVRRGELEQNKTGNVTYDPCQTYVAFVVGDGDNISYIMDQRAEWMRDRVEAVTEEHARGHSPRPPPPLTWTISPHLARLAPQVLEWYYAKGRETGADYFMLPPSGHLYAYPTSMPHDVQDDFVTATERDAELLDTSSTISWDWFTSWRRAEGHFLPKYGRNGSIRGIFASNVPFLFPTFTWRGSQYFKVLRGAGRTAQHPVVLFRPREWRGVDPTGRGGHYHLSPQQMADELASYPRGTVAYIYMSSDAGLRLKNSFMTVHRLLPEHVRLVSADTAANLALQASCSTST